MDDGRRKGKPKMVIDKVREGNMSIMEIWNWIVLLIEERHGGG